MTNATPPNSNDADALLSTILDETARRCPPVLRRPAVLRLVRRVPSVQAALSPILTDPLERAEAGLEAPPHEEDPIRAVRAGLASLEAGKGVDARRAAAWEEQFTGDERMWVEAARLHLCVSDARERAARAALSTNDLPYVFPGELHPLSVDVLAGGDRVLTALHVDWARKVSRWLGDALTADARQVGFWFWPHLRFLEIGQLRRPVVALANLRRVPVGAQGMRVAYLARMGEPWAEDLAALPPDEQAVAAVAITSDRRQEA